MLVDKSLLITSYSSLEIPAQARCSHFRQDSHSIALNTVLFNILTVFDKYKDLTRLVFGLFRRWRASSSSSHAFRYSVKVKCSHIRGTKLLNIASLTGTVNGLTADTFDANIENYNQIVANIELYFMLWLKS